MKTTRFSAGLLAASALLLANHAHAQVVSINSVTSSVASITFNDTNSFNTSSLAGLTNGGPSVAPWTGGTLSLPLTPDSVTLDKARGDMTAAVISGNYDLAFANVLLTQTPLNTGFAQLMFQFSVEFQLGALGLPVQPTLFPLFNVTGTVQSPLGSFAAITGFINYSGTVVPGTITNVETVNYGQTFNTPGSFTGTATGVASFGNTPTLLPFTTLTLSGTINFVVDPASISASSVTAPEPGSAVLALLAGLPLLLRRRRA